VVKSTSRSARTDAFLHAEKCHAAPRYQGVEDLDLPQMIDETAPFPAHGKTSEPAAVSLVGFMGAGKTTVGRALATRLAWRFVDLDDLIQAQEGRTIEQIFQESGEAAFRETECRVLRETIVRLNAGSLVLALGGGAFCEPSNRDSLEEAGIPVIFLDAPAEELFRRSEQPDMIRPLRRDLEQFQQLYEQRRPVYLKSGLCIQTDGKDIASVVDEIIAALKLVPNPGAPE
jgi:shikimate kinase